MGRGPCAVRGGGGGGAERGGEGGCGNRGTTMLTVSEGSGATTARSAEELSRLGL